MARRKKYKHIVDPVLKASTVVATYLAKAEKELDKWANTYKNKITQYEGDVAKQLRAIVGMAGFYAGFTPEVKNEIRSAVAKAVANKDRALAEFEKVAEEKGIKPIVPDKAKELAKKISEIVTVPVPAGE